ncbi:MAG TPA: hypothetical protein VGJ20_22715 [Xanthobacteraceae bacterium]
MFKAVCIIFAVSVATLTVVTAIGAGISAYQEPEHIGDIAQIFLPAVAVAIVMILAVLYVPLARAKDRAAAERIRTRLKLMIDRCHDLYATYRQAVRTGEIDSDTLIRMIALDAIEYALWYVAEGKTQTRMVQNLEFQISEAERGRARLVSWEGEKAIMHKIGATVSALTATSLKPLLAEIKSYAEEHTTAAVTDRASGAAQATTLLLQLPGP